ncbi:unnamed protein product, partial [Rotaria sp. Silwood1]
GVLVIDIPLLNSVLNQ